MSSCQLTRNFVYLQFSYLDCYAKNDPEELKANHTTNFEELWDKTLICFRQFIHLHLNDEEKPLYTMKNHDGNASLCQNCSEIYNRMRHYFWDNVVSSTDSGTIGGVCYDIRDRVSTSRCGLTHFSHLMSFFRSLI